MNKQAFDEVIGDPFSTYDIVGQYDIFRSRSAIPAINNMALDSSGGAGSSHNAARPNVIDFLCDVENAIEAGLEQYIDSHDTLERQPFNDKLLDNFFLTYISHAGEYIKQTDRAEIEQYVGRVLLARKISPVVRYFTATRTRQKR
jgi:hypothetical protein